MDGSKNQRVDARNNKAHITKVANALFLEHGVEVVSMQKIAKEADVGTGTLYRHFKNKSALCLELIDEDVKQFIEKVDDYMRKSTDEYTKKRGETLIGFIIELKENNLEMLTAIEKSGDKDKSFLQTPFYQYLQTIFVELFSKLSYIKDPEFHTDLLLNAFSSDIYNYQRFEKQLTKCQLCLKISDSFFKKF
jgi:AcrR family transcriptional regulator